MIAVSATSDRVCEEIRVCGDDEFEVKAPTETSDRECEPLTKCYVVGEMSGSGSVMGMMSGQCYQTELAKMYQKYGDKFGGIYLWEYFNAIPTPRGWAETVKKILALN